LVTYPRNDGQFVTFIHQAPDKCDVSARDFSTLSVNYYRWIADIEAQGYKVHEYEKPDFYDGRSNKQIEMYRKLRADFDAYLHWEFEEFNFIEKSIVISEDDRKAYSLMGTQWAYNDEETEVPATINEEYEFHDAMEPWSELRFVSTSSIDDAKKIVGEVIRRFEKYEFINNKSELEKGFPNYVTGYPYLIRSFKLPTGELACDVEIDVDELDSDRNKKIQKEQEGWIQQASLTNSMTQSDDVEAILTVYSPSNGNAKFAYCDKEFWDNDRLWGDVDDICFETGIRFSDCSLVINILIESEQKIEKHNSLAKNLKNIINELKNDLGIELQFKRSAKYYLSLEDLDDQYNWIENPLVD